MAGDVYGQGQLPLVPPYSFQILAGHTDHVVVRDYVSHQRDTMEANSHRFAHMEIAALQTELRNVDFAAIAAGQLPWPLTGVILASDRDGQEWSLEFPIAHFNHRTTSNSFEFQIETGPILVPSTLLAPAAATIMGGYTLAYVFINRFDRADLAVLRPFATGKSRRYTDFARLDAITVAVLA